MKRRKNQGIFKKEGIWHIDYYLDGRGSQRVRERIGSSFQLAQIALSKRKLEIAEGKYIHKKKIKRMGFEELSDMYMELHSKPNKKSWYRSDIKSIKSLQNYFGGKNIHKITQEMVEGFKCARSKAKKKNGKILAPATVNRELACLRTMFNKAMQWGKIKYNPVKNVKLFRENNERTRYLEKNEIVRLLSQSADHLKPIIILALNTGMRKGEMLGLKRENVDFNRDIIYITDSKDGKAAWIHMNQTARNAILSSIKHDDSEYVFAKPGGMSYGNVRTAFEKACKRAEIKNFRFHDLRHTFASHLVMSGVDLNTVRELMRHKSMAMTLRYAHLSSDHKKRAVAVLDKIGGHLVDTKAIVDKTPEKDISYKALTLDNL